MKTLDTASSAELQTTGREHSRALGAILVEKGILSPAGVESIQRFAAENALRFGDAALRLKLLTQSDIDMAIAHQFNYPILPRGGGNGVDADLIAGYNPQSEFVEPVRALRSQLLLRWGNDVSRKILAVASAERGEGRSWLAANLATAFAQISERTLLIDADMRHPRQHEIFNLSNTVGLSALLTGRAGREIVRRIHPQLRLFVLCAGILPPNPQELLGRPAFEVILGHFAEQFSVVIIDTPALTDVADAQILAARAGSAIMLTRRNHTRQDRVVSAMRQLTQTGTNVIGCVLNEH